MENTTIEVPGCEKCPFAQRDNAAFDYCGIDDKDRRIPIMGCPEYCPLNTHEVTVRKAVPEQQFEERGRIEEIRLIGKRSEE